MSVRLGHEERQSLSRMALRGAHLPHSFMLFLSSLNATFRSCPAQVDRGIKRVTVTLDARRVFFHLISFFAVRFFDQLFPGPFRFGCRVVTQHKDEYPRST